MSKLERMLAQDDLFGRVIYAFLGIGLCSFAFTLVPDLFSRSYVDYGFWTKLIGWTGAASSLFLAPIFLVQALARPSTLAHILTRDLLFDLREQHKHLVFNLLFLLAPVIVTIGLRIIGIRGYMTP